jgi:hypothetical protein
MGFQLNTSVLNQKGSPAIYTDTFANRPNFGFAGRLFISNDTAAIYEDTGTAWVLIANVSSGAGTLQQVTTNGNTSNVGISVTAGGVSTNSLTDTALTLGSVPFTGAGGLISQDNANFFWDDTNNRLGINTNTPGNSLDVHSAGTNPILALNNTAGSQSAISFLNAAIAKWRIGNTSTNSFDIYNFALGSNAVSISTASNSVSFLASIKIQQGAGFAGVAGYNGIGCDAGGFFFELGTSTNNPYFNFIGLTGARTYTFPDATGTLALTSDLSAYLPLAGGTLTGALGGTSASFTSSVKIKQAAQTSTSGLLLENSVNDTQLRMYTDGTNWRISPAYSSGGSLLPLILTSSIGGADTLTATVLGNVVLNSTIDDTINKLQVNGSATFKGGISISSTTTLNYSGITTYPAQDNGTINLSTIFPGLVSFTGRFVSLQVQIVATNGGGGINSSIYNCSRSDTNVWTSTLVSTTGTVVAYTFTFAGSAASPTLAITDGIYIYKSVGYQIIMR